LTGLLAHLLSSLARGGDGPGANQGKIMMPSLARATPLVVVCTRDPAVAVRFYRATLGLALISQDAFAAVFALNGATLRVSTVGDWTAHDHTIFGFGVDDVAATVAALEQVSRALAREVCSSP
jgi:hypothetical protein